MLINFGLRLYLHPYSVWAEGKALVILHICAGSPEPLLLDNVIIRDYLMAFWLSPEVST